MSHAVEFAAQSNTPLALRSGGHSYPGYSAGGAPGTGAPPSLVLDARPLSTVTVNPDSAVTIGAGALLASVYSTLAVSGLGIPGGSCATVGITGLTLGGGVGVVTSLTFRTEPAPIISMLFLEWNFAAAQALILAWQQWAPGADQRL